MPVYLRLLGYLKPYRRTIFVGFMWLARGRLLGTLAPGLVWAYIVDTVILKRKISLLLPAVGVLLLLQALDAVSSATRSRLLESVGQRFVFDLRKRPVRQTHAPADGLLQRPRGPAT